MVVSTGVTALDARRNARLRPDLQLVRRDGALEVTDPLTRRVFRFDDVQGDVIGQLDGVRTAAAIATRVFDDPDAAPLVNRLIESLRRLGLLDAPIPDDLAVVQARHLREPARRQRDQRVAQTVRWAAAEIPLYQERIGALAAEVHGVADLVKLPTTTKTDARDNFPTGLLARGTSLTELLQRREVGISTSSGSTGGRLESVYYLGDPAPAALYLRHPGMRAAGDPDKIKIAQFTTPICSGAVCHRASPMASRMRDSGRQMPISSSERIMRLRKVELDKIAEEIDEFRPDVLYIDPVYATALVRALQRNRMPIPRVAALYSTYEFLSAVHAEVLTEAFGLPVYQFYGASEINDVAAVTCEHGRFHVLDERHVFEFLRDGKPVEPGTVGEITVTMLSRPYSRLIRYRVGDLGTPIERCDCAFDDLQAFELEGRIGDVVFTTRGEPVTTRQVDQLLVGLRWIDFYQLQQRDRRRYELIAVPRDGIDGHGDEECFRDRARALFGADAQISVGYVRELPVNPSLKYPPTVNRSNQIWKPNG